MRYDVLKQAEWRSYIGSGGYERTRLKWMLVGRHAEWSFHVRVDDEAFRPIVRAIGSLMPRDLAEAAAAAMDPGAESRPPSARRSRLA